MNRWLAWRLPGRAIGRQALRIRLMFRSPRGNALPLVKYDIMWALPIHFTMIYVRLFMREQGLSEVEIGTTSSFQVLAQIVGALCGGYLAERFGRLRTVTWIDAIVWPATFVIFATAQGYLSFLLGAILMGSIHLLVPAWVSLYVEGSPEYRRARLFAVRQIPWFISMLLVSLSGFLVHQWGVGFSCRVVFSFAAALTLFAVWYRNRFMVDTDPPLRPFRLRMAEVEHLVRAHWQAFRVIVNRKHMFIFLAIQTLALCALTTAGTFNYLYLTDPDGVGLPESVIASMPVFQGTTMLLTTFLVLPYVTGANVFRSLFVGVALMGMGAVILLLTPAGSLGIALLAYICGPAGFAIYNPSLSSHWANLMNDEERARVLALSNVLTLLAVVPVPTIAGGFYEINPRGPLMMILAFHMLNLGLIVWAATSRDRKWPGGLKRPGDAGS